MSTRMRQGLGLLCVALIAFAISVIAGLDAEPYSAGESVSRLTRAAAILLSIGGLAMLAGSLLSRKS
jgi:hypothetical protein